MLGCVWLIAAPACARPPVGFDLVRSGTSLEPAGFRFAGTAPAPATVEVDTERRPVLLAASGRWSWTGRVPREQPFLHAGVQLVPQAWAAASGLEVRIEAVDGTVREILEIARAKAGERQRWLDLDVDLGAYAGRKITLEFVAEPVGLAAGAARGQDVAWGPVRLASAVPPPRTRPNVLFVLVDTLRADHLPAYGYARDTAPNVQRFLAERGTVVEHAYAQAPWTLPSVTALLTGRQPGEVLGGGPGAYGLPAGVESMGEHFSRLGYRTAAFYANPTLYAGGGFDRGYETFYCPPPDLAYAMGLHAESVTGRAISWLEAHRDESFFAYVHLIDPHDPYDNPDIVANRSPFEEQPYTGRVSGLWVHGIWLGKIALQDPEADRAHLAALYDAEIRYADRRLGELFAALSPEVLRNTLIVFTADHGEELFDHGGWKHGQTLYEEQIHVPLIVRWDGHVPAGRRLDGTARLVDLLPTLNAAAGGERDPGWQGTDLLPALRGTAPIPRQSALARNLNAGPLRASVVVDGKKLVLFNRRSPFVPEDEQQERLWKIDLGRLQRAELYDLAADPGEHANLAESAPQARAERERAILRQLDRELSGMRVILSGLPVGRRVSGSIEFDTPPVRWSSYFLGDTDHVTLEGSRLRFDVLGDGLDKGVIVEGDFAALRSVESAIDGGGSLAVLFGGGPATGVVPVARLAVSEVPAAPQGPSMRLWIAAARGVKSALSQENAETLRRLRALGYIQ